MPEESRDMNTERTIQVAKESLRTLEKNTVVVCIDDRFAHQFGQPTPDSLREVFVTEEKDSGPQMPGGSAGILAVIAETSPEDRELNFDELWDVTLKAHERVGYKLGVHMDNHHDETSDGEIFEMVSGAISDPNAVSLPGCGYAAMLASEENPLDLSPKGHEFFKNANLIPTMVSRGSKLVELEGHHSNPDNEGALAISNMRPGTTLDHEKLKREGVKVYGHDPLVADELIVAAAEMLEQNGEKEWADNLRSKGSQIERSHHRIAAVKLTHREPVEIA